MKTSWKETKQLEDHLFRQISPEEALVLEARLVLNPDLQKRMHWQQKTYSLIRQYGRQQLRHEIQAVQHRLFHRPEHRSFRQTIRQLFSKH